MMGHIVVVGSLNMDLVMRTPHHPEIGEAVMGAEFHTFPGGKGANQAVAAARLGGKVKMIGRVGADDFGQALTDAVSKEGVDATFVQRDPSSTTGVALITVDDAGQNTMVVVPGANACLSAEDISAGEAAFDGAAILLIQVGSPTPALRQAIDLAKKYNAQVVFNPAPMRDLPRGILSKVDFLVLNRNELALLTGVEITSSAIGMIRNLGARNLIVTLGEEGVMVMEKKPRNIHPLVQYRSHRCDRSRRRLPGSLRRGINRGPAGTNGRRLGQRRRSDGGHPHRCAALSALL